MKSRIKLFFVWTLTFAMTFLTVGCSITLGESGGSNEPTGGEQGGNEFKTTDILLTDSGNTDYKIVISEDSNEVINNAAVELKNFIYEITNANLTIETDSGKTFNQSDKVISLGDTELFKGSGVVMESIDWKRDGFKIARRGNTVLINSKSDLGVLYGCYGFLEQQYNFAVYAGDEIYYDDCTTGKNYLKDINYNDIPDFEGRSTDGRLYYEQRTSALLRLNGLNGASYGGGASEDWVPNSAESFRLVIPKDMYEEEHPEWFKNTTIQLCLTAKGIVEETVERAKYFLTENPNATIFNMSQGDGNGYCTCSNCVKEIQTYMTSGYIIRFMNKVVEGLEEWHKATCPEREINYATFAYSNGAYAPVVTAAGGVYKPIDPSVVPHEKLRIYLTFMGWDYNHAVDAPSNAEMYTNVRRWQSICDNFYVYDYSANYAEYLEYFNDIPMMKSKYSLYKEIGVKRVFTQNTSYERMKSMGVLSNYIMTKLMWDTSLDTQVLIDDFMEHYYKEAAPYMKKYLEYLQLYIAIEDAKAQAEGDVLCLNLYEGYYRAKTNSEESIWTKTFVETAMGYLNKAMEMAENCGKDYQPTLVNRISEEKVCLGYTIVKNYNDYYDVSASVYKDYIDQWEKDAIKCGATHVAEKGMLSSFCNNLRAQINN